MSKSTIHVICYVYMFAQLALHQGTTLRVWAKKGYAYKVLQY